MLLRQFSLISLLIVFSLQPALPAKACLENCHSRSKNCHRVALSQSESVKCPHTNPVSTVEVVAKAGCECTIQGDSSTARDIQFTFDSFRSDRHKSSGNDAELSLVITPVLLKARLHGPPFPSIPHRQETFLINSNLRI
jgi:hypothetical protein